MPAQPNQISVHELLEMVFQNKWLFLLCTFLGGLLAWLVVERSDKWYESQADIQVIERNTDEPLLKGLSVTTTVNQRFNSVCRRILSPIRLDKMVRDLGDKNLRYLSKNTDEAVRDLASTIDMGVSLGSIFVRAERKDPREAQVIVDYLTKRLQEELNNVRENQIGETLVILEELLDQYTQQLEKSERVLKDFASMDIDVSLGSGDLLREANYLDMESKGPKGLIAQFLDFLQRQNDAEIKVKSLRAELDGVLAQIEKEPPFRVTQQTTERSELAKRLESLIARTSAELAVLMDDKSSSHPLVIEKQEDIARFRKQLEEGAGPVLKEEQRSVNPVLAQLEMKASGLSLEIPAQETERAQLEEKARALAERIQQIPAKELEKAQYKREMGIQAAMYTEIRKRYEDALLTNKLERADKDARFEVLSPASYNPQCIRPKRAFVVAMGVFLGMIVGTALSFLREFTNTSFRNLDDASRYLDLPVLGVIPELSGAVKRRQSRHVKQRAA